MKLKIGLLALLLLMVLMCPAAVMGADMTALDAAGSGATIVASATAIELVSVDPDVVSTTQGVTIPITITAEVFAPNGIGWIECVVISNVEPPYFHGSSLPIAMGIIGKEEIISARYEVTIDILCCQPEDNYTVTVTVADKDGNTATGTATVTVEKALASSVAEVEITPLCARIDSAVRGLTYNMTVTISNSGNETCTFDLMPEGGCSDWITVYNEDDPTTQITNVTIGSNKKARLIVKCVIPEDVKGKQNLAARIPYIKIQMTKTNAKRGVIALLLVAILVCSATAMAAAGEDAGSRVTIVSLTPEVTVAIDPEVAILTPGVIADGTITAEVFCPNSVGWIERVALRKVNPFFSPGEEMRVVLFTLSVP